jgi:hypothetical protein
VLLPWSDAQGITALKDQLQRQFQATLTHKSLPLDPQVRKKKDYLAKLLAIVPPGNPMSRSELATRMGITADALRRWLNKREKNEKHGKNEKELWGREIEWDVEVMGQRDRSIHVPQETQTEAILAQARKRVHTPAGAQYVPQTQAA